MSEDTIVRKGLENPRKTVNRSKAARKTEKQQRTALKELENQLEKPSVFAFCG